MKLFKIYLGHTSSIRQVQASDNYQIVVSLSAGGTILMHDIRSAECLRKLADPSVSPARVIAFSELGLVAVAFMEKKSTEIFSINGKHWVNSRTSIEDEDVWSMAFNKTGEFLVTGSNYSITFFDVIDHDIQDTNLMYQRVDNTVQTISIAKDEDYIVFVTNKDDRVAINLLKIKSKAKSLQTLRVIGQFV